MHLPPATSSVTLSRGGVFFAQSEQITDAENNRIVVNRILIEESRGAVATACCHWFDELLRKNETDLSKQLNEIRDQFGRTAKALSGTDPIGIFTVRALELRRYVQLDFRVLQPTYTTAYVGSCHLGIIKEIHPQIPHALPRTKRRQLV